MRFRRVACFTPLLAVGSLLIGCSNPDRPLSPKSDGPQFSRTASSGDAGKITFQSNRNGSFHIFVMNADGSNVTQLTNSPFDEYLPLFSPDASRITFGRCFGTCQVVVINADGSGERVVVNDGFPGAWSPDGNRIALGGSAGTGIEGIYVVNVDGSGLTRVADLQYVTDWSPDGRQLLLGNDSYGNFEIFALNLDNGGMTRLTNNPGNDGGAKWSPDGTRIAFNSDRDGGDFDVFVMNADGSGVTALTQNDGVSDAVGEWSPDGTQLAFSSDRDGDGEIFVMNADGTGQTQLTFNDGIADDGPSWFARVSPPNDDFANGTVISSLPFGAGVNLLTAGTEAGEGSPSCATFYGPVNNTVWYSFTPTQTQSITARIVNASINTVVAAYSGNAVTSLTELGCGVFGGSPTFRAEAGTTYHFLVGGLFGQGGPVEFRLEVTPPPVANLFYYPSDPTAFDVVQFIDQSYDPGGVGISARAWQFGDGATGSDCCPTHRYATDGSYTTQLTVTTPDGRTASTSQTVLVRTHDVAITRFQAPSAGMIGKTSKIAVDIRSNRYPETVQVQLFKSVPGGFQLVATSTQTLPTRNRITSVAFSYTFAPEDAIIGKVTFKAVASLLGARDALPADNEAIAPPTKVTR